MHEYEIFSLTMHEDVLWQFLPILYHPLANVRQKFRPVHLQRNMEVSMEVNCDSICSPFSLTWTISALDICQVLERL